MDSARFYRWVFFAGAAWNFLIAGMLAVLVRSLPTFLNIEAPRYPLFIHFNLMSIVLFGCMMWIIARDLNNHRSFVKLLVWAKLMMGGVFGISIILDSIPPQLISFLAPGIVVDIMFGVLFWRFLHIQPALPNAGEHFPPVAERHKEM